MTHRLTTNCAKNYCNWTLIVKVIVENVVTCFLGHSVFLCLEHPVTVLCFVLIAARYFINSTDRLCCDRKMFVWLSVRLSVTIRHCVKTAKPIDEILLPADRTIQTLLTTETTSD